MHPTSTMMMKTIDDSDITRFFLPFCATTNHTNPFLFSLNILQLKKSSTLYYANNPSIPLESRLENLSSRKNLYSSFCLFCCNLMYAYKTTCLFAKQKLYVVFQITAGICTYNLGSHVSWWALRRCIICATVMYIFYILICICSMTIDAEFRIGIIRLKYYFLLGLE